MSDQLTDYKSSYTINGKHLFLEQMNSYIGAPYLN